MRYCLILCLFAVTLLHAQQGGYSNPGSAAQGDSIKFYTSTSTSPFTLTIYRIGQTKQTMLSVPSLTGVVQTVPDSAYWYGCRWNATYAMKIPANWTSGLYTAEFPSVNGTEVIPFVVRQSVPGSTAKLAVNLMTFTFAAFDNFGGKSLYEYNSTNSVRSYKLSFDRPYGYLDELKWLTNLIKWLESQNIAYECLTDNDIDADSTILNNYNVLALAGHEEYISRPERTNMERLVNRGGRLISLSANTCYYQVRTENTGRTMVCYKWPTFDPLYGINNSLVTYKWSADPVNYPEILFLGAASSGGGSVNSGTVLPASQGYGDYAVTNSQHWIYQGTGLLDGSQFGSAAAIVGDQTDGAKFTWSGNGTPATTGVDQAPLNYRILGISPASDGSGAITGHATLGLYFAPSGGVVFNGATINYAQGLVSDAMVRQITKNVFTHFISNQFPPEMTAWSPARIVSDSVNHDFLYENKRDTTIQWTNVLPFSVTATDPRNESLTYRFLLNGTVVSTSSTYSFTGSNGVPGLNTITALAYNSHDTASISWAITVNNPALPPAPVLAAPLNGVFHQLLPLSFQWNSVSGATAYRIQISTDPNFVSGMVKDTTQTGTTYRTGALQYSTVYYWRANASNVAGAGAWSAGNSFTTSGPPLPAANNLQGGYTERLSYIPGDSVRFFISTSTNPFTLNIYRNGKTKLTMLTSPSLAGAIQTVPDSAYWYGCNWNVTYSFKIPANWLSGYYTAEFSSANGTEKVPFVVRQGTPGSTAKAVVALMSNTYQAFNTFGGKSFFDYNSTNSARSYKLSFDRPFGFLDELKWPTGLTQWLENQNIAYEFVAESDLDADPTILNNYNVVVLCGHHEFMSKPERSNIEGLLGRGGRLISLSGNTCFTQVRSESNSRTLVCYNWPTLDPLYGIDNSLVTYHWDVAPVNYPENLFLGAGTRNGGDVNAGSTLPQSLGYGDYAVTNSQHWIFRGTGLADGNEFGSVAAIVGSSADGALFTWNGTGNPVTTGADQAPLNYRILGISPASNSAGNGHATMGMYYGQNGSAVFNAATMNWAAGLASDAIVQQITKNVFDRFIAGHYPPDFTAWSPYHVGSDSVNHDFLYENRRDTTILTTNTLPFSVTATDPQNETVQYTWLLNNTAVGTGATYNFTGSNGIPGVNIITALAFNTRDTVSISWNITVNNPIALPAPLLIAPVSGVSHQKNAPLFQWNSVTNATSYEIQVSSDQTFGTVNFDVTLPDTTTTITNLLYSTQYYWRVKGTNATAPGTWSSVFHFLTVRPPLPYAVNQEGGYTNIGSVAQGDPINFYISTSTTPFTLTIYRMGATKQSMMTVPSLAGTVQPVPDSAFWYGCDWNLTYTLTIPATWKSGYYTAEFPSANGTQVVPFVVKQKVPGSSAKIIFMMMTNTIQAFNSFGGKSTYEYNSTDSVRSFKLSFNRPTSNMSDYGWDEHTIKWIESQPITCEYVTNADVDADSTLLNNYNVFVMAGHEEYWTRTQRRNVQNFVNRGGRMIILSGNNVWWQIRYENNNRTLVCYKWPTLDPMYGIADSLVTYNWVYPPLNYPSNSFIGEGWYYGGFVNYNGMLMKADGYGDYAAVNTQHWLYKGTGLVDGNEFGYNEGLVGYEADATLFNWNSMGLPVATGTDQSPLNMRIFAITPTTGGFGNGTHGTMGMYINPNGGAVFSCGTIGWSEGLFNADPVVERITKNVFDRFTAGQYPPDITAWTPSRAIADSVNHDFIYRNNRDTSIQWTDVLPFSVTANDPKGEALSYLWKVNSTAVGTSPTLNFTGASGITGLNTITAYAYNSHDTASISWRVTVNGFGIPPAPALLSPANNAAGQAITLPLRWNSAAGATSYNYQITTDSTFAAITVKDSTQSDTVSAALNLQFATRYFWRVSAANTAGTGVWSAVFVFTTIGPPIPAQVVLISPANRATGQDVNPRLVWRKASGATTYRLQVSLDSLFSSSVDDTTLADTACVDSGLQYSTKYFWRAVASNTYGAGAWSAVWSFTTLTPPPVPVLVSPTNNATGQAISATLRWKRATGAVSYRLQLTTDSTFATITVKDTTQVDTSASTGILQNITRYFWRVLASNAAGQSSWSALFAFTTVAPAAPGQVTLVSPASSATGQPLNLAFIWRKATGATAYRLQAATNSKFSASTIKKDTSIADTSLSGIGLANSTVYYWHVNASNAGGTGSWSSTRSLTTTAAPSAPALLTPAKGATGQPLLTTLVWKSVAAATLYRIQASTDSTFKTVTLEDTTQTDTDVTIGPLPYLTRCFWRVNASSAGFGTTAWATYSVFTTLAPPLPAQPILSSPSDNITGQPLNVQFAWQSAAGATSYRFQLAAGDSLFGAASIKKDTTTANSSLFVTVLDYSTHYYWRVAGINIGGAGLWSVVWDVSTIAPPFPPPALQLPANNATNLTLQPVFRWGRTDGATIFRLQVSTDSSFKAASAIDTTINDTSFSGKTLSKAVTYYWHVKASTTGGLISQWSARWKCTTVNTSLPGAVTLSSPSNNATNLAANVKLTWKSVNGATSYHVQVATDSLFLSGVKLDTVTKLTADTATSLTRSTKYFWRVAANNAAGQGTWSAVWKFTVSAIAKQAVWHTGSGADNATAFSLSRNYPNPFNPTTDFEYRISDLGFVSLKIFDQLGREVATIVNEMKDPGDYHVSWNAANIPSGVYFYRLDATSLADPARRFSQTYKMLLVK